MPGEVRVTIPNGSDEDPEHVVEAARGIDNVTHVSAQVDSRTEYPNPFTIYITPADMAGHVARVLSTHYKLNAFARQGN